MITLRITEATAREALSCMTRMLAMASLDKRAVEAEPPNIVRSHIIERFDQLQERTNALSLAIDLRRPESTPASSLRQMVRELHDVAALVDVARHTLSIEDYGDALDGAAKRLARLIAQLLPEGGTEA